MAFKRLATIYLVSVSIMLSLYGCASPTPTRDVSTPTTVPTTIPTTATPTLPPPTATLSALGSVSRPLILNLPPASIAQEVLSSGDALVKQLSALSGLEIKTNTPASYNAVIEGMSAGNIHIGWLSPVAYIIAKQKGAAEAELSIVRRGSNRTAVQFIAHTAFRFTPAKDDKEIETLKQFANKKPCWTDSQSLAGYVIPLGLLNKQNVKIKTGALLQGDSTVVKAVYLSSRSEICDFGATFDDARNSAIKDFPDVNEKVVVIYRSEPLVPYEVIAYSKDTPKEIRAKITTAFLKIAQTEDGKKMLQAVYQAEGLKQVEDSFYDSFRTYVEASGVETASLFK